MTGPTEQAAIYVRTAARDLERDALGEQEAVCRAHCAERGVRGRSDACVYRDVGSGLSLDDRGGLSLLRDEISAQRVAVVVAVSPDRLSRDETGLASLTDEAASSGVRVEYVNHPPALKHAGWSTSQRATVFPDETGKADPIASIRPNPLSCKLRYGSPSPSVVPSRDAARCGWAAPSTAPESHPATCGTGVARMGTQRTRHRPPDRARD